MGLFEGMVAALKAVASEFAGYFRTPLMELAAHFLLACFLLLSIKGLELYVKWLWPNGKVFWGVLDVHDILDTAHFVVLITFLIFFGSARFVIVSYRQLRD